MKFKGAIMDLDGTLLDSMWVWSEIDDIYIRSKGMIPEPDLSRKLARKNMMESVEYFQQAYNIHEPAEKMAADLWALAEYAYRHLTPLKPNVYNFLMECHRRNIRLVIATASDKEFTKAALQRCGVWHLFEGIITSDEIGKSKNEPDIFYAALHMLGLPIEQAVVFEDSLHAIETAKKAGFYTAAVYDKYSEPDKTALRETADFYLRTFLDWHFDATANL